MTEGVSHKSQQLPLMKDSLPNLTMICRIKRASCGRIPILHNTVSNVWNDAIHRGDNERSKYRNNTSGMSGILGVDELIETGE